MTEQTTLWPERPSTALPRPPGPTTDWPSISIVIPTYQRRDMVCQAVRALADVRYAGPIELIVIVDGSTDGTASALHAIEPPFPFAIVEQPNGGAAESRNRGAALAQNDVILFLDDDMVADPGLLVEHTRLHREGADAVIGDTLIHPDSPEGFLPRSISRWITSTRVKSPLSPFDIFSGQLSVSRKLFEKLGGFDAKLTQGNAFGNEDSDFGARLLALHDVRHNPAAVSRQVYLVTPREYMGRASRAAIADVQFMAKHPGLARELLERKGYWRPLTRLVYRPLAWIPGAAALISGTALAIAEVARETPFRSSLAVSRLFSGARAISYWSALRKLGWLPVSGRVLALCYHAIEDQSDDPVLAPYGVSPELFAAQLDSLMERGFSFISPNQLAAFLESGAPLPSRPLLLTFDDGYADVAEAAQTVLKPRGIEAIVFAVTGSASNEWDQQYGAKFRPLLTAEQRDKLRSLGVEIASHSRTHREMTLLDSEELTSEATGSAADLAAGGHRPRFFAYPFGALDESSRQAVVDAGYVAAFGTGQRRIDRTSDRFNLPRVMILSSDRGWRFRMKTAAPVFWDWCERIHRKLARVAKRAAA